MNALQLVTDSFHTKKLCSRLCSIEVHFYEKRGFCVFQPPLGVLGVTYDDHRRRILTHPLSKRRFSIYFRP